MRGNPFGRIVLFRVLSGTAPLLVASCGAADLPSRCERQPAVRLRVVAAPDLNLDAEGESLPTRLRIVQLRSLRRVEEASFEDLWLNSAEVLAESVVGTDEVTLYPGRVLERRLDRSPDVHHVLIMAVFRQPEGRHWRVVLDLPPASASPDCRSSGEGDRNSAALDPRLELFAEFNRLHGMVTMERVDRISRGGS